MPGLTGEKLSKEVLRIRPDIPIILATGFEEKITETYALGLGIKKFVQKPIVNENLAIIIRKILNHKKQK